MGTATFVRFVSVPGTTDGLYRTVPIHVYESTNSSILTSPMKNGCSHSTTTSNIKNNKSYKRKYSDLSQEDSIDKTARERALTTDIVVSTICSYLPWKDQIGTCLQVCKTWKNQAATALRLCIFTPKSCSQKLSKLLQPTILERNTCAFPSTLLKTSLPSTPTTIIAWNTSLQRLDLLYPLDFAGCEVLAQWISNIVEAGLVINLEELNIQMSYWNFIFSSSVPDKGRLRHIMPRLKKLRLRNNYSLLEGNKKIQEYKPSTSTCSISDIVYMAPNLEELDSIGNTELYGNLNDLLPLSHTLRVLNIRNCKHVDSLEGSEWDNFLAQMPNLKVWNTMGIRSTK